ncbi:MAG TPA: hypothetical protein VNM92_05870 [Thermoanaerobaculia bacterium]|nr:hypothetical protein [Thermoanaerobaculia bacterium]
MAYPKRLTIVYEHPHWFTPLFQELERRGVPFRKIDVSTSSFDSAEIDASRDIVFNRVSASSWTRGRGHLIGEARNWLARAERDGVETINGASTFDLEISKAAQLDLLEAVGARAPRARIAGGPADLVAVSSALEFPLVVKPNVGGSGAGIRLFATVEELATAVREGTIEQPLGDVILLQEYHPPATQSIVRVETLEGRYLYGIRIHLADNAGFDLCPADVCRTTTGIELTSTACAAGAEKQQLSVEAYTPPSDVVATIERIAREARLDVGGIEYLESGRDGQIYYYDINALSNFVADPLCVVGFDPTARVVDFIDRRLGRRASVAETPIDPGVLTAETVVEGETVRQGSLARGRLAAARLAGGAR